MEEKINLQFSLDSNNFNLLENDGYCSIAEIDFLHVGLNRNKCNISEDSVKKSLKSFYNKPLLCILDNSIIPSLSEDFKEHAYTEDERKKFIAFGTIPESSEFRFVERDNGKKYLSAKVVIWKNYFPVIMNILKRRAGNVKVSIELAVINGEQDKISGVLDIKEFRLLSCVLLGENIKEGIEGSHMEVLRFSFSDQDIDQANKFYTMFSDKNTFYEIPNSIKQATKIGLESYKSIGKGCTPQELAMAHHLSTDEYIDRFQLTNIMDILKKAQKVKKSFAFSLLGGNEMLDWIKNIVEERVGGILMNSLSNSELQEKIYQETGKYKYKDGNWEGQKYYVEEIYSDEKIIIVRDNETAEYFKVPYSVEGNKISVDMTNKTEVHKTYEEVEKNFSLYEPVVFAKEDYGKGEKIEIDESKESMSETSWGSIDKTKLRKQVLSAKNYKTLVKKVYLIVEEGWEDSPSSKLKYPIMEIKDGKAVYNRYALASALGYAEQHNETEVIKKVKSLYKKLDIDNKEEGGEKEMSDEEIKKEEIIENSIVEDSEVKEEIENTVEVEMAETEKEEKEEEKVEETTDSETEEVITNSAEEDNDEDEHQSEVSAPEIITNAEQSEEGAEEEEDSEKEDLEEKVNALEIKNAEIEAELKKYKRAEEEKAMCDELEKFAHCMSDAEKEEIKNSIKDMEMSEFKNKLNEKIAEFALKMKDTEKEIVEEKEVKYSLNPFFELNTMEFSKEEIGDLDSIISNHSVKITGKK